MMAQDSNRKTTEKVIVALLFTLGALYAALVSIDLFFPSLFTLSSWFKFIGIVLCLIVACAAAQCPLDRTDARYNCVAMLFTVAADVFLLFTTSYEAGIALFCVAHLLRIRLLCGKRPSLALLFADIALCFILIFGVHLSQLYALSICYALLLLSATISTFISRRFPRRNAILLRLGMILFLLCDINVALFNIASPFAAAAVLMWVFYLPSQVLLALSMYDGLCCA